LCGRQLEGTDRGTVFDEPDLTNSYRVDGDGFITFPYIGRVPASGLTLVELQDRIRGLLAAGFIKNPQVRAEVSEFKSQSVLVSGEVRQPGKVTMTGTMTLLEALAAAGSTTSSASSELTVARPKKPGETDSDVARINWSEDAPTQAISSAHVQGEKRPVGPLSAGERISESGLQSFGCRAPAVGTVSHCRRRRFPSTTRRDRA
jgi:protein involved in polysaccharide export with SLBB domain